MDSVPASFSWLRLKVILQVRKVIGCLRDSINLSTDLPDGSINFAEMISFVKVSFSRIAVGHPRTPHIVIFSLGSNGWEARKLGSSEAPHRFPLTT